MNNGVDIICDICPNVKMSLTKTVGTKQSGKQYRMRWFKCPVCGMSDLIKPIEHKGEKFVPIDRFLEDIVREWNMCNINYPNDAKGLYGDIIKNITSCEFWIIQKLIEWHFDIADLISKGEAIDVNTLEEDPYK